MEVSEFKDLIDTMFEQKKVAEEAKRVHSEEYAVFDALKNKVLAYLDDKQLDTFDAGTCKVIRIMKSSAKFPKDLEAKKELFEYLKLKHGNEVLENMLIINSASFNAFYNKEEEAATDAGEFDFEMPGVAQPKPYSILQVRKK